MQTDSECSTHSLLKIFLTFKLFSWFTSNHTEIVGLQGWWAVWPEKIAKCLEKLPKNDFTTKMIDFDTFTKIDQDCERFGQIHCCQRLYKVAQSAKNCPIWSHWRWVCTGKLD